MTEPGADPRAREEAAEMGDTLYLLTDDGPLAAGDCPTLHPVCTRAELWAAIEAWVNEAGCVCDDLVYTTARLEPLRQRVRALLGLEPES